MNKEKIKSEIIQDFLVDYVKKLAKQYKNYFTIDNNMVNDDEMYIYIDSIHKEENFSDYNLYLICLDDFKKVCEEFIDMIGYELPTMNLFFTKNWYGEHLKENGEKCYKTCELHFKIVE